MVGWFKRLSSGTEPDRLPGDRDAQKEWIKAKFKNWQSQWHTIFDSDGALIATGEFDRPDPLPLEIDRDYRLIFGFSRAKPETRRQCFALFHEGAEMHRRFETYLTSTPAPILEVEARIQLDLIVGTINKIGPNEKVNFSKIKIIDRDTIEGQNIVNKTDDILVLLEGSLLKPSLTSELPSLAARSFITEPLYASAGNFYHVHNWVSSATTGGQDDVLQSQLYFLWRGGWQVLLDEEGVVLAQRKI